MAQKNIKTMIVLGSGGHTAEMLTLVDKLDHNQYTPRCYVVAATDKMGKNKALSAEQAFLRKGGSGQEGRSQQEAQIEIIPRSREVGQSWLTSFFTTLYAVVYAFGIVFRQRPDLVLVNGPGTCFPICLAAFVFRVFGRGRGKIVYVESIARVTSLSLSGKVLYKLRMADSFFVQWPVMQQKFPRSQYQGRLY